MFMQIRIGTSGWQYSDWNRRFYPIGIKNEDKLPYFSEFFSTVEINSTFYHMPQTSSVKGWYEEVPKGFVFAVKMNRYITHTKRLSPDKDLDDAIAAFYDHIRHLKERLGVILVQLPPSMTVDISRLSHLVDQTAKAAERYKMEFRLALEFRHASWLTHEVFAFLRSAHVATVINDSPKRWPATKEITSDIAYIRFHGSKYLYRSSYTHKELQLWAAFIKEQCLGCKQVFVYFNNDRAAAAIDNATELKRLTR